MVLRRETHSSSLSLSYTLTHTHTYTHNEGVGGIPAVLEEGHPLLHLDSLDLLLQKTVTFSFDTPLQLSNGRSMTVE